MKVFSIIKRNKLTLGGALLLFVLMGFLLVKIKPAKALLGFGGVVKSITVCTCSPIPSYLIVVGPPTGGQLVYTELTNKYSYYNIWGTGSFAGSTWTPIPTGTWLLGGYIPGGACLMTGTPCYPIPTVTGTMTQVGTSMGPAI